MKRIKEKKSLLFYGELPSDAVHGIACSNLINLRILKTGFEITVIEEETSIKKDKTSSIRKFFYRTKEHWFIIRTTFRQRYDFFYLTLSISFAGGLKTLGSIICFRLFSRGSVVLHIHRGDFMHWYNKSLLNRYLANFVIKLSSKMIVLSDLYREIFERMYDKPVYVLHNTVENEYDYPLKEKEDKRFIFISNYLYEKGIIDLLEVFSKLLWEYPEITLHTFGAFPSEKMKDRISKYSNPKIFIGGVITGEEKFNEIRQADCLILPSFNEGEPIVLLEAMSVGTPVISTNVGLIPEMLGSDYPFLSIPGDQASLEEKIIRFMDYPDKYEISKTLKNRYSMHYSNDIHKKTLMSVFNLFCA